MLSPPLPHHRHLGSRSLTFLLFGVQPQTSKEMRVKRASHSRHIRVKNVGRFHVLVDILVTFFCFSQLPGTARYPGKNSRHKRVTNASHTRHTRVTTWLGLSNWRVRSQVSSKHLRSSHFRRRAAKLPMHVGYHTAVAHSEIQGVGQGLVPGSGLLWPPSALPPSSSF